MKHSLNERCIRRSSGNNREETKNCVIKLKNWREHTGSCWSLVNDSLPCSAPWEFVLFDWKWSHLLCVRLLLLQQKYNSLHKNLDTIAIYLSNTKYFSFLTYTYVMFTTLPPGQLSMSMCYSAIQFHIFPLFNFWYWKHLLCNARFVHFQYTHMVYKILLFSRHGAFYIHREREREREYVPPKIYWEKQFIIEATTNKKNKNKGKEMKSMCNNCKQISLF